MAIYILPSFLSPSECEESKALFPASKPATINVEGGFTAVRAHRQGRVALLESCTPLSVKIKELIENVNDRIFHFEIKDVESLQLAEYRYGDNYDWHLDIGPGKAGYRKVSASVQLSDAASYDGGDLEIKGHNQIDRAQGTIILFPSYLLHRVTPVTRGVRHALVTWSVGQHAFR